MNESPNGQQLVGRYDPDLGSYAVVGFLSGPAGTASLALAGGRVTVDFDTANPSVVSHIEVEAPERDDVAVALAGVTGVPDLAARLRVTDPEPRIIWTGDELSTYRNRAGSGSSLYAQLALALAEHTMPRRSERVRGIAALEAANELFVADPTLGIPLRPLAFWRQAADALDGNSPLSPKLADAVRRASEYTRDLDDDVSRRFAEVLRRDESFAGFSPGDADAAPAMAASAPAPAAAAAPRAAGARRTQREPAGPRFDVVVAIDPEADLVPLHAHLADGVLEVGAGGLRGRTVYLRAFRADRTPLAVVPFQSTQFDSGVATAVVPRQPDAIIADIVLAPDTPYASARVREVMRATRLGQDAARTQRVRGRAEREWLACESAWTNAGDERRANIAHSYATGDRRQLPPSIALLSDRS